MENNYRPPDFEAAVSAKRCSDTQGCQICNYMEESGNSTYLVLQLKASIYSNNRYNYKRAITCKAYRHLSNIHL